MTNINFAIKLAREAGDIMRQYFKIGVEHIAKHDKSPVTEADIKINNLVIEQVKATFSDHGVLGEEASWNLPSKLTWVCDPIDGTRPFVYGLPYSVFSLALADDGQPVLAVVYDPFSDRLYHAEKNKGAFLNDEKIKVNNKDNLSESIIATGKHSAAVLGVDPSDLLREIADKSQSILTLQCVVQQIMLVALGQIEGDVFMYDTAHDIATGKLIVEEAGGKVTDLEGNQQRYDQPIKGAIISNGKIHSQLTDIVLELKNNK